MYKVKVTNVFRDWFESLKDSRTQKRIQARIDRAELGNFGDNKPVGDGVSEMRLFFGPGYRLYYTIRNDEIIFLLCGGDKSTQATDIKQAKEINKAI